MSREARLRAHIQALAGERHPFFSPTALQQAEHYLRDQFQRLGLEVSTHSFESFGTLYRNVIGTLRPPVIHRRSAVLENPSPLIIAAHYDTVPGSPGADDNASGIAVMLEAARDLAKARLHGEVRFIGFCLEEENLLGSLAYARALKAAGQKIRGAIVLECVGYSRSESGSQQKPPGVPIPVPTSGDFLAIVGNVASADLTNSFEQAANNKVPGLNTVSLVVPGQGEQFPDTRRSDHAAFWCYGYPAVMLTDTANFRNPHYHQPTDTIETLNFAFMEHVAEAVAAAAIKLSGRR